MKIKIILAINNEIIYSGISKMISDVNDIEICCYAKNSNELQESIKTNLPDIIIIDSSLPTTPCVDLIRFVNNNFHKIKFLVFSIKPDDELVYGSIKAGAKGIICLNVTSSELLEAIYTVKNGYDFYSQSISSIVLKKYMKKSTVNKTDLNDAEKSLTNRQMEILKLFGDGYNNQEIADILFISVRTVETHKNHIMQKLKLKNVVDLIKFGIKNNIIDIY